MQNSFPETARRSFNAIRAMPSISPSYICRRGQMLWFRRSVPSDLISRLGKPDIRRSLRTSDFRIARRRASTLVRVVEEAFETLRSARLGPRARSALAAILDHVMDDFDGDRRRWADRAKHQILMERLAGGGTSRPMVIDGAPKLIMDDDSADLISADTDAFVQAELLMASMARTATSEHHEVCCREGGTVGQGGELNRGDGARAVTVVEQLSGVCLVNDPIVSLGSKARRDGLAGASR